MTDRYANYKLGLGLDEGARSALGVDLDYQPTGVLELDPRPVSAEELKSWRAQTVGPKPRHRCQPEHLTQAECAERFGIPTATWRNWEHRGLDAMPCWCALLREFFIDDITVEYSDASRRKVVALANILGGLHVLAEEIGQTHEAVRLWRHRDAGRKGGGGPLVLWLFDEFALEEQDAVRRSQWKAKLTRSEVREIRRRYDTGEETVVEIAAGFDASYQTVYAAARRQSYEWVEEAS